MHLDTAYCLPAAAQTIVLSAHKQHSVMHCQWALQIQELRKSDERKTALATIAMSEAAPDGTLAIRARGQTTQMP